MKMRTVGNRRVGFTLVEAMVSISLAALAGSVLLAGINASVKVTDDAMHETIAMGVAQQLMDEIAAQPRGDGTTKAATCRKDFADIDDYNGYRAAPADMWGHPLGLDHITDDGEGTLRAETFRVASAFLNRCLVKVAMTTADDGYRYLVTVTVADTGQNHREMARLQRVVTYVQ
jgi:type II secretory pathway pseudopilin PulG